MLQPLDSSLLRGSSSAMLEASHTRRNIPSIAPDARKRSVFGVSSHEDSVEMALIHEQSALHRTPSSSKIAHHDSVQPLVVLDF